jgi:hypothetical protein
MPIKSKAQRRKFAELLVKGEISPETFEKWNRGAGKAELPERVEPKAKPKKKKKKKKRKTKSTRGVKSTAGRAKKRSAPPKPRR